MNLKKIFTMGVVMTTILWSLGVATLVPSVVSAADASCPTLVAGDLIKVSGKPAIYALDNNLNYRYFPDGDVFKSWNMDESYSKYYKSITQACFDSLAQPAAAPYHVFYRSGSYLVKYLSSDTLYVVGLGNKLHPITDAAAKAIFGTNYTWKTIGLSEWPLYTKDTVTITEATVYPGMLAKVDGKTYFVDEGKVLREVTAEGMTANRFKAAFVRTLGTSAIAGLTMGATISSEVTSLTKRVGDSSTPGTTPAPTTNVTVSLAADTPASMTVPGGSTNVTMLKFHVNGSGIVNQIILKRNGIGANTDLTNVYLYNGTTRLTSGRTIASDTNTVTFGSLNVSLPATLTAVGDFTVAGGNNGNQSGLSVVKVNTVDISNVDGNYFSVNTNATASAVTIDDISGNWEVTLGSTGADLAKFKVVAGVNDINVSRVVLRQGGALANTNLANLKLYVGSTLLATASSLEGEKLIFNLTTPYTIAKSQTKNFTVTGDLTGGRTTDNVKFYVDEVTDLYVVDAMYGVGARVTNLWALGDQIVNMAGGQITLADNGPAASTIAVNTTNNSLLNVNVSSERNVTVKKVKLTVTVGGAFAYPGDVTDIKNVKLVDTDSGYTLVGPADLSSFTDTNPTFTKEFTDSFDLTAGSVRHLAIQADFDTALTNLATVKATLDLSGANYLYDNDASEYMASTKIVPSSLVGKDMTASTASVTITKTATPNNSTQVKGNKDVNALGISFSAGTAQDLKLNKVVLAVYGNSATNVWATATGDTDANTLVESISLWDGSTQLSTSKSLTLVDNDSSGTFTAGDWYKAEFTNLALTLEKGSNKQLVAKVNLRNTFAGTKYLAVDADQALMEIENAEGNLLTGLTGKLNGTTTKTPLITAVQSGTLTAAVDGNTPTTGMVLTGASNIVYTIYRFSAADEAFTIVGSKIVNSDPTKDATFNKITLEYKNEAGTTVTKEGYLSAGALTFSDGQLDLFVPANTNAILTVKADLNKADDAGTWGNALKIGLEKSANQFGASANLTNAFIAIGKASGTKVYGNTNNITLVDSTVNAKTARKTNIVVANAKTDGASSQKLNDNVGTYTFTSEAEAGSNQNSTVTAVTVALSGSMITAGGDNLVTVKVYDSASFGAESLMGQANLAVAGGAITGAITLTARNEFNGVKTLYFVVDSTDVNLTPATTGTKTLGSQITTFTWDDGKATGITPIAGVPVVGATMSYSL